MEEPASGAAGGGALLLWKIKNPAATTTTAKIAGTILFQGTSWALEAAAIFALFCGAGSKTVSGILAVAAGCGLGAGGAASFTRAAPAPTLPLGTAPKTL